MLPRIARRLHLDERQARRLRDLIRHHTLLSRISMRRDYRDEALLDDTAQKVRNLERLDLLYLITWCDASSVGRGSWPGWQDALLYDLYQRLRIVLSQDARPVSEGTLEEIILRDLSGDIDPAAVREHCRTVPPRYHYEVMPEDALRHIRLVCRLEGEPVAMEFSERGALVDFWIVSRDRAGRFARLAGAFGGLEINIIGAQAYRRSDGINIDHFVVAKTGRQKAATLARRVSETIEKIFRGELAPEKMLAKARRRVRVSDDVHVRIEPQVLVDNRLSPDFTIVDVTCGDRIGLLWRLANGIADAGLDIHFARISTIRGQATDVFYVTDARTGEKLQGDERIAEFRDRLLSVCRDMQEAKR